VNRGHVPIRTCLVCGRKNSKSALLRLAVAPVDRVIFMDREQRLEGRGAYVCQGCLPRLRFTKRVQKAFRNEATGLAQNIG
jgi:predicted RNA-binding protein YlxR (DUF448 family)